MNISVINNCVGCSSCKQICAKKCITLMQNNEGFYYPYVDASSCINCELCLKRCPQWVKVERSSPKECYAAWILHSKKLAVSSSGGLFRAIADFVMKSGGIVYGAAYCDDLYVKHIRTENEEELARICGSKYVESDCSEIYSAVKTDLNNNKMVLFTGTPCQCAGLLAYLSKKYDNLICVDIICHGVPSRKLFGTYIKNLEKKNKGKIEVFDFRNKVKHGWSLTYLYKIRKSSGKLLIKTQIASLSSYYYAFLKGITYRESCYTCRYSNSSRIGDITIGDFWGVEKHDIRSNYNGVSCVLINSDCGKNVFNAIKGLIHCELVSFEMISLNNGNLLKPSKRDEVRDYIYKELNEFGYKNIEKKYMIPKNILIEKIKTCIPNKHRQGVKKLLKRKHL